MAVEICVDFKTVARPHIIMAFVFLMEEDDDVKCQIVLRVSKVEVSVSLMVAGNDV